MLWCVLLHFVFYPSAWKAIVKFTGNLLNTTLEAGHVGFFLSHTIGLFTKKDLLSASHTDSFTASTDNLFWESGNPDTTHV